jgi:pyruvate dehydrogenase E1 component alpha subunit
VLSPETSRRIFETMTLVKKCDERVRTLLSSGQFAHPYYSPRGQEVIAAAVSAALAPDDYTVTTYRGLHDQLARGVPLNELLAEYLGKRTGISKGKGGPMHVASPDHGVMVTTGIVGGGLPIANGLALAEQLRGGNRVTVVNFGDGASNIGAFHEALNLASVWSLPVVFLCQNNRYAEHTPYDECTSVAQVSDRAIGYSMPGVTVDGNNAEDMYAAAVEAIERARAGDGPTLIEALTYRFYGHNAGDPMAYMPKDERDAAMEADPVVVFRALLIDNGTMLESELGDIEQRIELAIDEAVAFALSAPLPESGDLMEDVYAS